MILLLVRQEILYLFYKVANFLFPAFHQYRITLHETCTYILQLAIPLLFLGVLTILPPLQAYY